MKPNVITLIVIGILTSRSNKGKNARPNATEKNDNNDALISKANSDKVIPAISLGSANSKQEIKNIPVRTNN